MYKKQCSLNGKLRNFEIGCNTFTISNTQYCVSSLFTDHIDLDYECNFTNLFTSFFTYILSLLWRVRRFPKPTNCFMNTYIIDLHIFIFVFVYTIFTLCFTLLFSSMQPILFHFRFLYLLCFVQINGENLN